MLLPQAVSGVWFTLLLQSTLARGEGTESGVERAPELVQFNKTQCLDAIKAVQESKKYSEDNIASQCADKMEFARCDFFAETLSLASKHTDFEPPHFCRDMEAAHFLFNNYGQAVDFHPCCRPRIWRVHQSQTTT